MGPLCAISVPVMVLGVLLHHRLLSLGGDAGEMGAVPREVRAGGCGSSGRTEAVSTLV